MTITVIVDDSDHEVAYIGAWTETQASALSSSGIEQSVGNTLHSASGDENGTGSSLSYNFSGKICLCSDCSEVAWIYSCFYIIGSTVSVFALMMPDVVNTATVPYSWQCYIDQIQIAATPLALQKLTEPTTIKICEVTDLTDGPHQLNFYFNSFQASDVIYFDYIEYFPTRSATPQTFSFIAVSFDDEAIIYNDGWSNTTLDDGTNTMGKISFSVAMALNYSSTIQLQFNGSSVR